MSVLTAIYQQLATYTTLTEQLSKSGVDPEAPAIYEGWADPAADFPYICLTFSFAEGEHFAKREGSLDIDIFTDRDSTQAEYIRNLINERIDLVGIETDEDGLIRIYNTGDSYLSEEDNDIHHWNMTFDVIYWRKDFISQLNERGF